MATNKKSKASEQPTTPAAKQPVAATPQSKSKRPAIATIAKPVVSNWNVLLWIVLAVFIVYGQSLKFQCTGLDDKLYFVDNAPYFQDFGNFVKGFKESCVMDYYRPILWGTFIIDAQFAKTGLFYYHVSNLLYHIFACYLIFLLLMKFKMDRWFAMFTVLIYAVHPLYAMAVAWVPGRNDPLLTIFIVAGFTNFINYYETKDNKHLFFHLINLAAALYTKETSGFFPFILGFYLLLFRPKQIFAKESYVLVAWWVAIAIPWYYLRVVALEAADKNGIRFNNLITGWSAFKINFPLFFESFGKFFVPLKLSVFPTFNTLSTSVGVAVIVVVFGTILFLKYSNWKMFIFCLAWFLVFMVPTMLFVFDDTGRYDYLEHRIYLPAIAILLLLNDVVKSLKEREIVLNKDWVRNIGLGIIAVFAVYAFVYSKGFKDPLTYWTTAITDSPHTSMPYKGLGNYYLEKNDIEMAEKQFLRYMDVNKEDKKVTNALGEYFESKNDLARAERYYQRSIKQSPQNADFITDLARIYEKTNRTDQAFEAYAQAYKANPNAVDAIFGLGVIYFKKGNQVEAEKYWKEVTVKNKNYINAYTNLAVLYYYQQNYLLALAQLDTIRARGQDPMKINQQLTQALEPYRNTIRK